MDPEKGNHDELLGEQERIDELFEKSLLLANDNFFKTGRIILTLVSGAIVLSINSIRVSAVHYRFPGILIFSWSLGMLIIIAFSFLMKNAQHIINRYTGDTIKIKSLNATIMLKIRNGELTKENLWTSEEYLEFRALLSFDDMKSILRMQDRGYMSILYAFILFLLALVIFFAINIRCMI